MKQSTFRAKIGTTRDTSGARGQTDLLLAALVARHLGLVTPREEIATVAQLFAAELH